MARTSIVLLTLALFPLLQPGCGSSDGKKKVSEGPRYTGGGEGGGFSRDGSSGAGEGGTPGTSGTGATAGTTSQAGAGEGGTGFSSAGEGGTAVSSAGEGGEAGTTGGSIECPAGPADCNEPGTDGCETLLATADDCGFCGRDCGAQACTNKLCEPAKVGGALSAYRWARTADALYRITGATPAYGLASNYVVTRTPLNGSAEVVMHSDAKNPGGLAVDESYVYWAVNGTPPAVLKKGHDAAAATTPTPVFEPVSLPVQMVIQGGYMYWTNLAGQIFRRAMNAPLADGGTEIVSAADVVGTGVFQIHQDLVASPSALYWVVLPSSGNQAFIRTATLTGASPANVTGAITNEYLRLSLAGEDLYWIRATGSALDGAYHYKPGGQVESLVLQAGLNAVHAAGDYLYLLGGTNTLYRAPRAGGNSLTLGSSAGLAYAMDFAGSDATTVYVQTTFTHGAGFFTDSGGKALGYPL